MSPGFPASLFELLADHLGVDLAFDSSRSGPAPDDDPFTNGRFDLGWVCSTSFVDLSLRSEDPSVQLVGVAWVPADVRSAGLPVYFSDLVVRPDSSVTSLEDLAGLRIGCNDPISLSGHHALRFEISNRGGDPDDFAHLVFTGGHDRSIEMVASGDLDAAVVDSVVRTRRARAEPDVAALRVVDAFGPWPVQPLVASTTLSEAACATITKTILATNLDPQMQTELDAAGLQCFVPIGADHYASVRRAMISV